MDQSPKDLASSSPSPSPNQKPSAQLSAIKQRLEDLNQLLPKDTKEATKILLSAYHQRHKDNNIKEFFDCLKEYLTYPDAAEGSVKVYTCCTAETFRADKALLRQVNMQQDLLVETTDLQECSIVILFCPINSRVGSDVEAAMSRVPGDKKVILVVMHHTRKVDYSMCGTKWSDLFSNVVLDVNVLFHETKGGLLDSPTNEQAVQQIQHELQKLSGISITTNTGRAQGQLSQDPVQNGLKPVKSSTPGRDPISCCIS